MKPTTMCQTAEILLAADATKAHAHQLNNEALVAFLFGGKAIFTLFNATSGTRYTYLAEKKEYTFQSKTTGRDVQGTCFWFSLLTGPHNTKDYTFLGSIKDETVRTFELHKKSRVGSADLPSVKAIDWLLGRIRGFETGQKDSVMVGLEFWHAGRCCRCGLALTVPTSVKAGIGPECAGKVAKGIEPTRKVAVLG